MIQNNIFEKSFSILTLPQRSAVENISDNLLITAGPGSGKTQLLSMRVAYILKNVVGIYPSNILLLTFTNAGVKAMKDRLTKIIGLEGYDVNVYTFHSFANKIISESIVDAYELKDRVLMNDIERFQLLEYLIDNIQGIDDLKNFNNPYIYVYHIASAISAVKREGYTPDDIDVMSDDNIDFNLGKSLRSELEKNKSKDKFKKKWNAFKVIYRAYEEYLDVGKFFKYKGRYDYDDLVNIAYRVLKNNIDLKNIFAETYQYIMVDEFQDTNGSQLKLLFELINRDFTNLCVVGDDDQSIYRFQGANLTNYDKLHFFFKDQNPLVQIDLDKNFRSYANIVDLSNKFISQLDSKYRLQKVVSNAFLQESIYDISFNKYRSNGEEIYGIKKIIEDIKTNEQDNEYTVAILCRRNNQVSALADFCRINGISFMIDGKENLLNTTIVRQILRIFELLISISKGDIDDAMIFEVLNYDFFQIPLIDLQNMIAQYKYDKDKLIRKIKKEDNDNQIHIDIEPKNNNIYNLYQYLITRFEIDKILLSVRFVDDLKQNITDKDPFIKAIAILSYFARNIDVIPLNILIIDLIFVLDLNDFLLKSFDDRGVLDELSINGLSGFVNYCRNIVQIEKDDIIFGVKDFLEYMDIAKKYNISIEGELNNHKSSIVHILTAHGSKGLEYDYVIIPSIIEGIWPESAKVEYLKVPIEILAQKNEGDGNIDEMRIIDEKRLLYVAITRAKKQVIMSGYEDSKSKISRFVDELGISVQEFYFEDISKHVLSDIDIIGGTHDDTYALLKDVVSEFTLNPTSLTTYRTCPRKFLYKSLLQTPSSKNQANIYGSAVHFALEKSFLSLMKNNIISDWNEFKKQFDFYIDVESVDAQIKHYCKNNDRIINLQKWYEQYTNKAIKPYKLEYSTTIIIDNKKYFSGKCDKIEKLDDKKNEFVVVDYKTGKSSKHIKDTSHLLYPDLGIRRSVYEFDIAHDDFDEYLIQLIAYKMLLEHEFKNHKVVKGKLVFIDPLDEDIKKLNYIEGDFVECEVDLKDEYVDMLKKYINQVYDDIYALRFDKIPLDMDDKIPEVCSRCEYRWICKRGD